MIESLDQRKQKLKKYFGILSKEEAEAWWKEIKERRRKDEELLNKKLKKFLS